MRTIIDLPPALLNALDVWRRRERISRAEAVRRAVEAMVGQQAATARAAAFGLWRSRNQADSLAYQRSIRREWGSP
jgi:hypothetical protein